MCGIAGFYGQGDSDDLTRMISCLSHRGPDDMGIFTKGNIHLAHARLSIIDLSATGHQPMVDGDSGLTVVFNGEIYNFQEHRRELQRKGYNFRGTSDTEVILALFKEFGEKSFSMLHGMFAIALWNSKTETLYLVRDRMGKKPLYWSLVSNTLIFGSELKSVLAHPLVKKEFSPEALSLYLSHEYIPTPHTPFKGIFKAKPGHYLAYNGSYIREYSFWDTSFLQNDVTTKTTAELVEELDSQLRMSVEERLVSDVPLGVFLSGGLDSSTVSYYAADLLKKGGGKPLKTFSIGFEEASFDESHYAKVISNHLGTEHHNRIFSVNEALKILPELAKMMDEPFADASLLPTSLLSRFAREHVTVALGGDGGDELFLGYNTFPAHKMAALTQGVPGVLMSALAKSVNLLPTSHGYMSLDFKLKRFFRGASLPPLERDQAWMGAFSTQEIDRLLSPEVAREIRDLDMLASEKQYWKEVSGSELRHMSWVYARTYMMDGVMVKVDRSSMFASLETRAPLLATRLVEFALSLPDDQKMKGLAVKHLLKEVMRDKLPANIVYRKKKGFGVPVGSWLRGSLRPLLEEKLSRERIGKQGLFTPTIVDRLVQEHVNGSVDRRKELWTLLMFQLWYDAWYE